MGYSDLTSLLIYLYTQCGLVTLHGPVVAKDIHPDLALAVQRQIKGVLMGDDDAMQPPECLMQSLTVLSPGEAEGHLLGGLFVVTRLRRGHTVFTRYARRHFVFGGSRRAALCH